MSPIEITHVTSNIKKKASNDILYEIRTTFFYSVDKINCFDALAKNNNLTLRKKGKIKQKNNNNTKPLLLSCLNSA